MRLWSIHPKYLDKKGLVALWRESLLAKKVLQGKTKGYRNHPQLLRFKNTEDPVRFINTYLYQVWIEACERDYCFDKRKIGQKKTRKKILLTNGQLDYEFRHLKKKLRTRDPEIYKQLSSVKRVEPNPIFSVKRGKVEAWEK